MIAMAFQISGVSMVCSTVCSGADQGKISAPCHWPLWGEFTGDLWLPLTKGQRHGKCLHVMPSSWCVWFHHSIPMTHHQESRQHTFRFVQHKHVLDVFSLQWRHNDHDGVWIHQPHGCLLNRSFGRRSKRTSKLRVTGLCAGDSPGPVNSHTKCFHLMTSSCAMFILSFYRRFYGFYLFQWPLQLSQRVAD